ncbi:MAG: hypothetical protein KDC24_06560, partial [Saprospiraceae bacterium]|nr:hypothetical protein [Saprospiraceae bacterium]
MRLIPTLIIILVSNFVVAQEIIHSAIVPWQPNRLTVSGSSLYFVSSDDNVSNGLWQTDGSESGTFKVESNFGISEVRSLIDFNDNLFFVGYADGYGLELWKKSDSSQSPTLIKELNPGPNGIISNNENHFISSISRGVIFTSTFNGPQVWITDGTENGTVLVLDNCEAAYFYEWKDELYFYQTNSNPGLYKTDGTPGNKILIKADVSPLIIDNFYQAISATDSNLFFIYEYYDGGSSLNMELWKSDGSSTGTQKVINLEERQFGRTQRRFWTNDTHLFFVGYQESTGEEPWISDGTTAGTKILKDISSGNRSSSPR